MTCIVGLVDNNSVYIGGDSAGVDSGSLAISTRGDSKVFKNSDYIFGFTSSFRMGQILRYRFVPPKLTSWDLERHMSTTFVDEVRKVFSEYGYGGKCSTWGDHGGSFLVGTRDLDSTARLFNIEGDYQLGWSTHEYNATGCGEKIALGALFATRQLGIDPERRVTLALEAATEYSAGVRGPFNVISI